MTANRAEIAPHQPGVQLNIVHGMCMPIARGHHPYHKQTSRSYSQAFHTNIILVRVDAVRLCCRERMRQQYLRKRRTNQCQKGMFLASKASPAPAMPRRLDACAAHSLGTSGQEEHSARVARHSVYTRLGIRHGGLDEPPQTRHRSPRGLDCLVRRSSRS